MNRNFKLTIASKAKKQIDPNYPVDPNYPTLPYLSEHVHGSLGIRRGHFACLFSFIEVRASKFVCSRGLFENAPRVDAEIFDTDEKICVLKISGYVWTGPKTN